MRRRSLPELENRHKNRFKKAAIGDQEAVFWSVRTIGFLNHADEMLNILCMDGHVDRRKEWKGKRTNIYFSECKDAKTRGGYIDIGN